MKDYIAKNRAEKYIENSFTFFIRVDNIFLKDVYVDVKYRPDPDCR